MERENLIIKEKIQDFGVRALVAIKSQEDKINQVESSVYKGVLYSTLAIGILLATMNGAEAVTVDALRAPIQDLKKEIFGGWMMVVKIAAIAIGGIFSVVKQSLLPFGIGGGASAGIHFGDKWLGDGSAAVI